MKKLNIHLFNTYLDIQVLGSNLEMMLNSWSAWSGSIDRCGHTNIAE